MSQYVIYYYQEIYYFSFAFSGSTSHSFLSSLLMHLNFSPLVCLFRRREEGLTDRQAKGEGVSKYGITCGEDWFRCGEGGI